MYHDQFQVGVLVASSIRDHLMPAFDDFLQSFTQVNSTYLAVIERNINKDIMQVEIL